MIWHVTYVMIGACVFYAEGRGTSHSIPQEMSFESHG